MKETDMLERPKYLREIANLQMFTLTSASSKASLVSTSDSSFG